VVGLVITIEYWPWASYLHLRASVTKQYNLVPAKGDDLLAGKITADLAESNDSLSPGLPLLHFRQNSSTSDGHYPRGYCGLLFI